MMSKVFESILSRYKDAQPNGGVSPSQGDYTQNENNQNKLSLANAIQNPQNMFQTALQQQLQQKQQQPQQMQQQQTSPQMQPNDSIDMLGANLLGFKPFSTVMNGNLVTLNPLTGNISQVKIGPSDRENKIAESDVKKMSELEDSAAASQALKPIYDNLSQLTSNPVFQNMRNIPGAPSFELSYYEKTGTPEQREMIGQYKAAAASYVTTAAKTFGPRMTNNELNFIKQMKIGDNDTIESAQGKLKVMEYFNSINQQRSELAAQLMRDYNISEPQAMKIAQEKIDTSKTLKEIENKYTKKDYRMFTIENPETGEKKTVSLEEAKKFLPPNEYNKLKKLGAG